MYKIKEKQMNLRDLQYFLAVYETQHFGKAAERCFVSQPALSMQIKKLEEFLGVTLFERSGKQFIYTAVSHKLAAHAKIILQHTDSIKAVARSHQDPFSGEFSIGAFPTISAYFFSRTIPDITKKYPQLTLLLTEEKSDIILTKLIEGKLDVAILSLPQTHHNLEYEILFNDQFYLAVALDHPWAKHKVINFDEIYNQNVLLLEDGHCLRDQCLDICLSNPGFKSHPFKATSMQTLKQMIAANVGVTLIPESMQDKQDKIAYIAFKDKQLSRQIGLVWRKQAANNEVINILRKACKKIFT